MDQLYTVEVKIFPRGGGRGVLGLMFAGYVPLAYPIIVYFLASCRPHLSHFLENLIFAIPTSSLSIYASTLSMWFRRQNVMQSNNARLLLNLINNNFLTFFYQESSHFESLLTPKIRKFATLF